ncbi:MAG: tyrosine-protein phosphatase [Rubrivivax sp.]|jgi:protein-tyrosine phosphatase|nr:tyrosine-protein phosphatase [Rubrivivax sp.]
MSATPTDRTLPLEGASNFRDLGGYAGHDGRPLRWGQVYRSDHLAALSDADRARVARLGLGRAFDFRGREERAARPYELPGVSQHALTIEPTIVQRIGELAAAGESITAPVVFALMQDLYRMLVVERADRFAELFDALLDPHDERPVVFHCTAGKDRTGVAAALLLVALGVPRPVVMQDYLLTNALYRRPVLPPSQTPPDALAVLWRVDAAFLDAALQAIDALPGGMDAYLRRRLGLGDAGLRALAERFLTRA